MKKIYFSIFISILFIFFFISFPIKFISSNELLPKGSEKTKQIIFKVKDNFAEVEGIRKKIDLNKNIFPFFENNTLLIPLRFLVEEFDGTIEWNNFQKILSVSINKKQIKLWVDKTYIYINNNEFPIKTSPKIYNNRAFVSLDIISEYFNLDTTFNENKQEITVKHSNYSYTYDAKSSTPAFKPNTSNNSLLLSTDTNSDKAIPKTKNGLNLIWNDEFTDNFINENYWSYSIGADKWGNNELEYYTNRKENIRVENGNLVIEARKENYETKNYTSARINTQNKKYWQYGYIEARIKYPLQKGMWPAFWMMGNDLNWKTCPHPKCGEIDIMEHINKEDIIYAALHWDKKTKISISGKTKIQNPSDFHNYAIQWNKNTIKWFVDDKEYYSTSLNFNNSNTFRKDFFIIVNLAVGGTWPGNPDNSTMFPCQMYIDYVRVYQ